MGKAKLVERFWVLIAGCCATAAAIFLFLGKPAAAFVAGALGVLAWFLDMRRTLTKSLPKHAEEPQADEHALGDQDEA